MLQGWYIAMIACIRSKRVLACVEDCTDVFSKKLPHLDACASIDLHEIPEVVIEADYPETLRQILSDEEIEKRGDELSPAQISGSTKDSDDSRH